MICKFSAVYPKQNQAQLSVLFLLLHNSLIPIYICIVSYSPKTGIVSAILWFNLNYHLMKTGLYLDLNAKYFVFGHQLKERFWIMIMILKKNNKHVFIVIKEQFLIFYFYKKILTFKCAFSFCKHSLKLSITLFHTRLPERVNLTGLWF